MLHEIVGEALDAAGHRAEDVAQEAAGIVDDQREGLLHLADKGVEGLRVDAQQREHRLQHAAGQRAPVASERRLEDGQRAVDGGLECVEHGVDGAAQPLYQCVDALAQPFGNSFDGTLRGGDGAVDGRGEPRRQLWEDVAQQALHEPGEKGAKGGDRRLDEAADGVDQADGKITRGVEQHVDGRPHRVEDGADGADQRVERVPDKVDGPLPPALVLGVALGLALAIIGAALTRGDLGLGVAVGLVVAILHGTLVALDAVVDAGAILAAASVGLLLHTAHGRGLLVERALAFALNLGARLAHAVALILVGLLHQRLVARLGIVDRGLVLLVARRAGLGNLALRFAQAGAHAGRVVLVEGGLYLGRQVHGHVGRGPLGRGRCGDGGGVQAVDGVALVDGDRLHAFGAGPVDDRGLGAVERRASLRAAFIQLILQALRVALAFQRHARRLGRARGDAGVRGAHIFQRAIHLAGAVALACVAADGGIDYAAVGREATGRRRDRQIQRGRGTRRLRLDVDGGVGRGDGERFAFRRRLVREIGLEGGRLRLHGLRLGGHDRVDAVA